jgi:protein SCO1
MQIKTKYYWLLLLVPATFVIWFLFKVKENKPERQLPYFGPKHTVQKRDTSYHSIPYFEFLNQNNETVNSNTVSDKIYIAEFFFTTCKSICPVMNNNLKRVLKEFQNDADILILSHTVDPETDSVSVLKTYAENHASDSKQWQFLTGNKRKLYEIARKGYLLNAEEGDGGEEDFIHTQNFALVDKENHIRGYYDGTDSLEINRLILEINLLKKEYEFKKNTQH